MMGSTGSGVQNINTKGKVNWDHISVPNTAQTQSRRHASFLTAFKHKMNPKTDVT